MDLMKVIWYRLIAFVAQFIGAMAIIFFIFNIIPTDPIASYLLFLQPETEAERIFLENTLKAQWNLDKPLWEQVYLYTVNLITNGDFGKSWYGFSLNDRFSTALPYTATILLGAILLYIPLSAIIGILSASNDNAKFFSGSIDFITLIFYGIPYFVLGVGAIYFFIDTPYLVRFEFRGSLIDFWKLTIIPIIILTLSFTSYHYRHVKRIILETLSQNYIRTARAKGLPERLVIYKHALKNG